MMTDAEGIHNGQEMWKRAVDQHGVWAKLLKARIVFGTQVEKPA